MSDRTLRVYFGSVHNSLLLRQKIQVPHLRLEYKSLGWRSRSVLWCWRQYRSGEIWAVALTAPSDRCKRFLETIEQRESGVVPCVTGKIYLWNNIMYNVADGDHISEAVFKQFDSILKFQHRLHFGILYSDIRKGIWKVLCKSKPVE